MEPIVVISFGIKMEKCVRCPFSLAIEYLNIKEIGNFDALWCNEIFKIVEKSVFWLNLISQNSITLDQLNSAVIVS